MIFAGVEGYEFLAHFTSSVSFRGGTCSKLVLIKIAEGNSVEKLAELSGGPLNCLLKGVEYTCDYVANWVVQISKERNMELPIYGLVIFCLWILNFSVWA